MALSSREMRRVMQQIQSTEMTKLREAQRKQGRQRKRDREKRKSLETAGEPVPSSLSNEQHFRHMASMAGCPCFYPSLEDMHSDNFGSYMSSIIPQFAEEGMCKIIPPPEYKPGYHWTGIFHIRVHGC